MASLDEFTRQNIILKPETRTVWEIEDRLVGIGTPPFSKNYSIFRGLWKCIVSCV